MEVKEDEGVSWYYGCCGGEKKMEGDSEMEVEVVVRVVDKERR